MNTNPRSDICSVWLLLFPAFFFVFTRSRLQGSECEKVLFASVVSKLWKMWMSLHLHWMWNSFLHLLRQNCEKTWNSLHCAGTLLRIPVSILFVSICLLLPMVNDFQSSFGKRLQREEIEILPKRYVFVTSNMSGQNTASWSVQLFTLMSHLFRGR